LLGFLALGLGWYSQSDAVILAWLSGGLVLASAMFLDRPKWVLFPLDAAPHTRLAAACLVFLMVVGSAWQFRDVAMQIIHATETATETATAPISANQDQIGTRLDLWRNAIAAIQYAPLTGMGPGIHSGFTQPFGGQEAHNTLLDWGTQAGLIGVLTLVGYLTWILIQVTRRRHYELVALLLARRFQVPSATGLMIVDQ